MTSPSNPGPWTPGWRRAPRSSTTRISDTALAIATIGSLHVFVSALPHVERTLGDDESVDEVGKNVVLLLQYGGNKGFKMNLSNLNSEELIHLREAINHAFDKAAIVVAARDRVAEEAHEQGDDSFLRRHRTSPRISYFEREVI